MKAKFVKLSIVTSSDQKDAGQDHRSSGNFSTSHAPSDVAALFFTVSGANADDVQFDVNQDVSGGDPVIWKAVRNNDVREYHSHRSLYVADPQGASGDFVVTVWAALDSDEAAPLGAARRARSPRLPRRPR